ncbi:hypothetical protein RugamoR1_44280 [Rugamonas sp. R1(2021)]
MQVERGYGQRQRKQDELGQWKVEFATTQRQAGPRMHAQHRAGLLKRGGKRKATVQRQTVAPALARSQPQGNAGGGKRQTP